MLSHERACDLAARSRRLSFPPPCSTTKVLRTCQLWTCGRRAVWRVCSSY